MKNLILVLLICINISATYSQEHSILSYLPPNYTKDGSVDYTSYIQKYLDENQTVLFPNFPILINDTGLYLRNQQQIIFQKESKLILKPSSRGKYALIHINGVKDVILKDVRLEGDRYTHKGVSGEWGMGIEVINSQNITIQNSVISKFWGDGVYIAGKETDNVFIEGGFLKDNRRNGISILSGDNIHLKDISIEETKGTWPMSAIDIEPNSFGKDYLGKILLENITSRNNPRGISIVLSNYLSEAPSLIDIKIVGFKSIGDEIGIKVNSFVNRKVKSKKIVQLKGEIEFRNVSITKSSREPIMIKGKIEEYGLAPNFVFKNISVDAKFNLSNQFKKLDAKKFNLINK